MCKMLEEMREEAAKEAIHKQAVETAMKLLARGRDTKEEIAELTGLSVEKVKELIP